MVGEVTDCTKCKHARFLANDPLDGAGRWECTCPLPAWAEKTLDNVRQPEPCCMTDYSFPDYCAAFEED